MFLRKSILQLFFLAFASLFLACSEDDEKPAPQISSFEPASGTAGTQVTVTGSNFGTAPGVTLNGVPAVVQSSSETSLVFVVPASSTGSVSGKITVTRSDGKTVTSQTDFKTLVPPVINSFSPGKTSVGKTILIVGTYLSNATVKIGGQNASVVSNTATEIVVTVPVGAVSGKIIVTTVDGSAESASSFTLDPHLITTVLSGFNLAPISVIGPNETFYVDGTNFSPNASENIVKVNGVVIPVVTVNTDATRLTLKVPSTGVSSGPLTVTIGSLVVEYGTTITVPAGRWTQLQDFPGTARQGATAFVIGSKGYAGLGINAADLWEFDSATKSWTQKTSLPASTQSSDIAFSINGKGYVATANASEVDFWEYDPSGNSWTKKADLPVTARSGFSVSGRGYICGNDRTIWEYIPATNLWVKKNTFPGADRMFGVAVALNNKLYFGTGTADFTTNFKDFWEYDPATDQWTQKADFPAVARRNCIAFAVKGKVYVGAGESGSSVNDWRDGYYAFDPQTNTWTQSVSVQSSVKSGNVYFSIGDKGYMGLGGTFGQRQVWEFQPD